MRKLKKILLKILKYKQCLWCKKNYKGTGWVCRKCTNKAHLKLREQLCSLNFKEKIK